jgi:hypothetical protein
VGASITLRPDREVREQVEALEDHAHALAQLAHGHRAVVQQLLAVDGERAVLEHLQPVDAAQQRALARAALADDGDHLAALHVQVDALEHLVGAVRLAQRRDLNDGRHGERPFKHGGQRVFLAYRLTGKHSTKYSSATQLYTTKGLKVALVIMVPALVISTKPITDASAVPLTTCTRKPTVGGNRDAQRLRQDHVAHLLAEVQRQAAAPPPTGPSESRPRSRARSR